MNIKLKNGDILFIGSGSGKMENISSLGTNKNNNKNCLRLSSNSKTICSKCYTKKSFGMYPALENALNRNEFLKYRLLDAEEIKQLSFLKNQCVFRFESFGDIDTITQLQNYNNIASAYKNCVFGLWSKNYFILLKYFRSGFKLSKNINLILSSPFLNTPISNMFIDTIKKYHKKVISFTVYDKTHKQDQKINCGGKKCIDCLNCYNKNKIQNVNEILK